jgi:hypothetical protein
MKIIQGSLLGMGMLMLCTAGAVADDGPMFRKNVSGTPDWDTEFATIRMLPLYVPPQTSGGVQLEELVYYNADGAQVLEEREYVRPLITHYTDGHVDFIEEEGYGGFPGHGKRDAFGAVSLDDGATWKKTNLSRSGDRSSIKIKVGKKWVPYYGDVGRTFTASDGNKVLVTWVSKYCDSGSPNYAMTDAERDLVAPYVGYTAGECTDLFNEDGSIANLATPCLYMEDYFGVSGSQGIQSAADLAEDGYPLVGDYPFSCVWAARGVLMPPGDDGLSTFTWFKAERLTSGKRSANRPEAICVKGAGCVVTWQEDPEGIRPGEGEGPGEGWSGAVAHHQTDTWYSYIDWDDFDLVSTDGLTYGGTVDLATWIGENESGSPKAGIPMAIPVRLTDNAMCTADVDSTGAYTDDPYCHADFDGSGVADFCADSVLVTIEVPDEGGNAVQHDVQMCITEDGRLLRGNTASTRTRLSVHGYSTQCLFDRNNPDACPIDSAWFGMLYEENKGLGDICDDGDCLELTDADKRDMGKNVWYHTFDMFNPELVSQGLMVNQPAVYREDWTDPTDLLDQDTSMGYNFWYFTEDPIYNWQAGITTTTLYQSEIARRPSTMSQDWYDAGPSGLVAMHLWKQGIIRRGGPADIMARRWVMPVGTGTGECHDEYELCTTKYQEATTTYEQLQITQDCHWEPQWVAYTLNSAYKPNASCNTKPDQLKCYKYIDLNGIPTNDPGTYVDVQVCVDVETWLPVTSCDVSDPTNCRAETTWASVENCDAADPNCKEETTCEAVVSCDTADPDCTVTNVCEPAIDHLANPYDYYNIECLNADGTSGWLFTDGSNPRYVKGFCAAPAINLSGNTILTGETCGDAAACLDQFPFNDYFDDLDMTDALPISKIWTWEQTGPGYGETVTDTTLTNLDDMSWENPYDMAKGHRGFIAGDMVMAMYGWTNNWKALTEAKDIVNLYVRRSFDGGKTWSTLPASFTHTNGITYTGDGTTTCEWYGETGSVNEYPICVNYAAGQFEQARNVSQLLGNKVTVLDPRYTPTTRTINEAWVTTSSLPAGFIAPDYLDDIRDPSRFFMIYETGHSSAYDAGEAPPLDLFYSRAVNWGDDYLVWQDEADTSACLPSAADREEGDYDLSGFCNEFDAIEGSQFLESGEASVTCSPGGQFFYSVWNQWDFDKDGNEIGADAWFRRVLFLDDYIPLEYTTTTSP